MTSTDTQQNQNTSEEENREEQDGSETTESGGESSGDSSGSSMPALKSTTAQALLSGDDENHPCPEDLFSAVGNVFSQLEAVEKFMARRFDEISMEINATSQQIDMNEDGMTKRFSEILEILGAINYIGKGDSAANTGVELEAVIEDTESAANTILDSADRIASYVDENVDWNDENVRADIREQIKNDVQEILLACTFQDLTGQRIRNTLKNLHDIETRLSSTFERLGIEVTPPSDDDIAKHVSRASSQNEIDALLQGYSAAQGGAGSSNNSAPNQEAKSSGGAASQDDIDSMFD